MPLRDLTDSKAVLKTVRKFDELGRERFLQGHGFRPARTHFLKIDDHRYDSNAIPGSTHGHQHPTLGPLRAADFSSGEGQQ